MLVCQRKDTCVSKVESTLRRCVALAANVCSGLRKAPADQSRPQIMATEVVRLPPILNVRNFLAFAICRAPAWSVNC